VAQRERGERGAVIGGVKEHSLDLRKLAVEYGRDDLQLRAWATWVTICFRQPFRASFPGAADQVSTAARGGAGMRDSPRGRAEGS